MNLVKWFRRNKTKVMVVVIFIAIVGFVLGGLLQQLRYRQTVQNNVVAHYADNKKVKSRDLALAQRELEILQMVKADFMLQNFGIGGFRGPDLSSFLLGELLFSENRTSIQSIEQIKQVIRMNGYRISDEQLNKIYSLSFPRNVYWFLLKKEAMCIQKNS